MVAVETVISGGRGGGGLLDRSLAPRGKEHYKMEILIAAHEQQLTCTLDRILVQTVLYPRSLCKSRIGL